MGELIERVVAVCDSAAGELVEQRVLRWHWGPALFGYALTELDDHLGEPRYDRYLKRYCSRHASLRPGVDQSDTVAPGLVTYAMWKRTGWGEYRALTERVVDYIRHEPRLEGDATNHLGHSAIGRLYPRSVWVDSIMMFGVFAARYGAEQHDAGLLRIAARQPGALAGLLMDPDQGLWHHSWWAGRRRPYPEGVFWGRGNGWVMAALPMILDRLGPDDGLHRNHDHRAERAGIVELLAATSAALRPCQRADGTFGTLLLERSSYRELSATALIAAGWLHGARAGYLDGDYEDRGRAALDAVLDALVVRRGRPVMPEISGPTIPVPLLGAAGYRAVPRGSNHTYGLAALVFAALAAVRAPAPR